MKTIQILGAFALLLASPRALGAGPEAFPTARAAADALVAAAGKDDVKALLGILGPRGKALVVSGDDVQDRNDRAHFARAATEKLEVVTDPRSAHRATLAVGADAWPFPVPLVERDGKWTFSTKEGLKEVLDRRIGANELDAIEICRGYVDAQLEYASEDHDGNGVLEYAQKVVSAPGKRDGLVWNGPDGALEGPISDAIARAIAQGYTDRTKPFHGYRFRVLTRQGKHAPLGTMDYVVKGHMIGGFALVAWPAAYRSSGVKTFIVSHDGVVWEQDLGPDTAAIASRMKAFDPGPGWTKVP